MTLPTVVEITPQLEAVTPDTFIDGLAAPARAAGERALTTGRSVTRRGGPGRVAAVKAPVSAAAGSRDHRRRS